MLGDHGMLEKRSFYEESSRIPLLMKIPWISSRETRIEGSMGQVDLVPTLLEILDQPLPGHLEGKSLVPVLKGKTNLKENDVFMEWNGTSPDLPDRFLGSEEINTMLSFPYRSIVSERWKLNLSSKDQGELFNLDKDPFEQNNLFNSHEQKDRVQVLKDKIHKWQLETGDTVPIPD